jgi:2-oxoglutarate ferredoxin oxidoreductase subunit alpha
VPAPEVDSRGPTDGVRESVGIIALGGTHAAVSEATHRLRGRGIAIDYMRIRAFPFAPSVRAFIEAHPRCFVVEQNRDGQLRSLLAIETGIARDAMTSVLEYGGLPLTADFVEEELLKHLAATAHGVPYEAVTVSRTASPASR